MSRESMKYNGLTSDSILAFAEALVSKILTSFALLALFRTQMRPPKYGIVMINY